MFGGSSLIRFHGFPAMSELGRNASIHWVESASPLAGWLARLPPKQVVPIHGLWPVLEHGSMVETCLRFAFPTQCLAFLLTPPPILLSPFHSSRMFVRPPFLFIIFFWTAESMLRPKLLLFLHSKKRGREGESFGGYRRCEKLSSSFIHKVGEVKDDEAAIEIKESDMFYWLEKEAAYNPFLSLPFPLLLPHSFKVVRNRLFDLSPWRVVAWTKD